jgi:hypothetical protein
MEDGSVRGKTHTNNAVWLEFFRWKRIKETISSRCEEV